MHIFPFLLCLSLLLFSAIWPHKRLTRTCLWVSRSLCWRPGLALACCRVGALSADLHAQDLLKEVVIFFITSTTVWSQVKQQKIGFKIYWNWPSKESWVLKNWCCWNVVLEKTLESPLDCKEIQPAHPKGDQSWIFTGRTDVEDEIPILWPPDVKSLLICKDPDVGKDWRQEEKRTTEDEMVGWHHWHEFE